ncbi:MAG TPA: hypothetical protein VFQ68_17270 [Streptosporangiaceae bacterium]|nr:hypothetical protein [Streptosporangiaceae bacterium]
MSRTAAVRAAVVPGWLAEVVRPRSAPVPWPAMIRAALAICVPLSVAFALGRGPLGVLPATGGLLGTLADTGGPYLNRMKRVAIAAAGGAAGLTIGAVTHGHGWLAVVALVVVAGVSGVLSTAGDLGSVTGLQLLVYTALGAGPIGALRPVWHTAAGFGVGVLWALILLVPGWLRTPYGREQRYLEEVLGGQGPDAAAGVSSRARRRRPTYRALADLRAEFQRTMSEPPSISRRAAAWWPAVVGLEQVMDAITSAGLAASRDQGQAASPDGVRRLRDALRVIEEAARTGMPLAEVPGLPDEEALKPVSEAIRSLLGVLGPGQRLTLEG